MSTETQGRRLHLGAPRPLMAAGQPGVAANNTSSAPLGGRYSPTTRHYSPTSARDIVRLYQCRICSLILREPVTLPCGNNLCKRCLPESHARTNITYPALPGRLRGFRCPFTDCSKEHALEDCSVDVILNKAAQHVQDDIRRGQAVEEELAQSKTQEPRQEEGGVGGLNEDESPAVTVIGGGKLAATWAMAERGDLKVDAEVSCDEISQSSSSDVDPAEEEILCQAKDAARIEMDCQVCYALFYDPLTTGCGHTFCRSCLQRTLDRSRYCPLCRCSLSVSPLLNRNSSPSNRTLSRIIETCWWDELMGRKTALAAEAMSRYSEADIPLFICTLSLPMMPTFLHIFEPRYRLLIRRALEGDRTFGMVLPKRDRSGDGPQPQELGTLLRIVNAQFYSDGRSLIETVGVSRFRVLRHGHLDGYMVGKIERVDDLSVEEQETAEASEAIPEPIDGEGNDGKSIKSSSSEGRRSQGSNAPSPTRSNTSRSSRSPSSASRPHNWDAMSTQALMRFASSFVARMHAQSAPWMAARLLDFYGNCPEDPAIFPWWFASMLPVREAEKYRLLGTSSVRERLKICCSWIMELEASRWTGRVDHRSGLSTIALFSEDSESE